MENNYQLSRIYNYVNGLMAKEDMHAFELEALNDPFLQDAIDGYKLKNGIDVKQLSLLQQQLAKRVEAQATNKHKQFFGWQRLAIGLTAAVLFIAVCTLMLLRYFPQQKEVQLQEVQMMDVQLDIMAQGDAMPVGGWEVFKSAILFSEVNLTDYIGQDLNVVGEVDAVGHAINITISPNIANEFSLNEYLIKEVKWQGKHIDFTLKVK